jgi:hypothetical protein
MAIPTMQSDCAKAQRLSQESKEIERGQYNKTIVRLVENNVLLDLYHAIKALLLI